MEIITETHRKSKYGFDIYELKINPLFPISVSQNVFGYDPGTVHSGVATIWRNVIHIYEITQVRSPNPVERILIVQTIFSECCKMFDFAPIMIIEGSSFGSNYRNTELGEVRASAVLWAVSHGVKPKIVPPLTIRKTVFGSAKIKAEATWEDIPPNAASALACAYFGLKNSNPLSPETKE